MNRKSYSELIKERYIIENNENARVLSYQELDGFDGRETVFYDDLPNTEVKGFPIASDFADENGNAIDYASYEKLSKKEKEKYRLRYHFLPLMHELYIGTTGSGKTTTCIEPQIRAISSQKNKPNMFVSDPKGEIYLHNVKHLVDNGYNVQVLNFKNVKYSHCWNPLDEIYTKQVQIPLIGNDAIYEKGNEFDKKKYKLFDENEKFNNGYHILFNGYAFASYKTFSSYVEGQRYLAHAEVTSLVNQLCSQMFPDGASGTSDVTWQNGSREFFNGVILALLEDAINPNKHFTRDMFNVKTLNDVFTLTTKYGVDGHQKETDMFLAFKKGKSKEALDKIEIVSDTASSTKKGFQSTCQSMIGKWMNGHIFSLTTHTNISLDDKDKPIALFIITRDYDKSDNAVAALFLNWVYRQFLEQAEKEEREDGISGGRPIHFLLDEFANIPAIPDFEIKIATSRSRNMWFHLYLQSYEQLDAVYNAGKASIIFDNCNQQIFLGSQSYETKERFSKECGQKTVETLKSRLHGLNEEVHTVPVLNLSELNSIKTGWMYVKRIKKDTFKSTYIRSYQCANEGIFKDFNNNAFEKFAPLNLTNPNLPKYQYKEVIPDVFKEEAGYLTLESDIDDDDFDFNFFKKGGR